MDDILQQVADDIHVFGVIGTQITPNLLRSVAKYAIIHMALKPNDGKAVNPMEIYTFRFGLFINLLYALMAVGMAAVTAFVIRSAIRQAKNGSKIQVKRILVFVPFVLIPLAFSILFGSLFAKYAAFDYHMSRGNASFLEGDVILVSCEEEYYRGEPSGYTVVIEADGQRISPSNTFSKEVVDAFESNQTLVIQYGEIQHDGTYIWRIKTSE